MPTPVVQAPPDETASSIPTTPATNNMPRGRKRVSPKAATPSKSTRKIKTNVTATPPIPTGAAVAAPAPTHILLIDNGGNSLKYGILTPFPSNNIHSSNIQSTATATATETQQPLCSQMLNITARLKHQWAILVGDEVTTIQPNQIQTKMRSTERGCITNMGNQVQVWKALLDKLRIHLPLHPTHNTASLTTPTTTSSRRSTVMSNATVVGNNNTSMTASEAFGWKMSKQPKEKSVYEPSTMAVVIMLSTPFCPRTIMEQIFQVWFQDFGFGHVGIVTCQAFGMNHHPNIKNLSTTETQVRSSDNNTTTHNNDRTECCTVVDLGWSASQVVPTYQNKILQDGIRRMPLGTRHLVGLWKYYCSYRQWNLMDDDLLLDHVHESLAFVSLQFKKDMEVARHLYPGKRPWDREYVLPDFQATYKGYARLTPWLLKLESEEQQQQLLQEQQEQASAQAKIKGEQDLNEFRLLENREGDAEQKASEREGDEEDEVDDANGESNSDMGIDDIDEDVDSEEETDYQRRVRLLRQKAQDERRRAELEAEHQVLLVSVERFAIPEVLFHPSDAQLGNFGGLPQTICAAIQACPRIYQSALYGNIRLVGGMSNIPNLKERLEAELRALTPSNYALTIEVAEDPILESWKNAKTWLEHTPYTEWSISRAEFEATKGGWGRLLNNKLGKLV